MDGDAYVSHVCEKVMSTQGMQFSRLLHLSQRAFLSSCADDSGLRTKPFELSSFGL